MPAGRAPRRRAPSVSRFVTRRVEVVSPNTASRPPRLGGGRPPPPSAALELAVRRAGLVPSRGGSRGARARRWVGRAPPPPPPAGGVEKKGGCRGVGVGDPRFMIPGSCVLEWAPCCVWPAGPAIWSTVGIHKKAEAGRVHRNNSGADFTRIASPVEAGDFGRPVLCGRTHPRGSGGC